MADEIKPKMVSGEAVCSDGCPYSKFVTDLIYNTVGNHRCMKIDKWVYRQSPCPPHYRARVAELEEALNRHAPHIDTIMRQERRIAELEAEVKWLKEMKTEREKRLSAALEETTARAEAAEAERDRLAAKLKRVGDELEQAEACLAAGEHWKNEQAENQCMRHINQARAALADSEEHGTKGGDDDSDSK